MSSLSFLCVNLFQRKPVRSWMTILSLAIAFLLFVFLQTVAAWFQGDALEGVSEIRLVVAPRFSQSDQLPFWFQERISEVHGVAEITHQTWFGSNYQDPKNTFPTFVVEPQSYFAMYSESTVESTTLEAFENTRTGAIVTQNLLQQYGWQIGDRIPIQSSIWTKQDGNQTWEFDLVGVYQWSEKGQSLMLVNYDYFDNARSFAQDTVGWFTVRVTDPTAVNRVASEIDSLFANSAHPTQTSTESDYYRAFLAQVGDIGQLVTVILSAVFFTIVLLTGVTMRQSLRERIPELAILKSLGFSNRRLALMVLCESVLLCIIGASLGILAVALVEIPLNTTMLEANIGVFDVSVGVISKAASIALALGFLVGVGPAWTANRLSIVEALRRT